LSDRKEDPKDSTQDFEKARARQNTSEEKYILRLYVAGMSPRSIRAIENIQKISEESLMGRYELEVIDVYQQPELAKKEQLLAAPTLIKKLPLPLRRLIGDMSDKERILVGLDLVPKNQPKKDQKDAKTDEN
jgi:circadian clock protein KaiB